MAFAALAATATACAGGETSGGSSTSVTGTNATAPALASTPQSGLLKGRSLPLEDYMQTYQQTVTITRAVGVLETRCMADYGFDFQPPEAGRTPPPNDNDANIERRYGISNRKIAEKYGYGLVEQGEQTGGKMPHLTASAALVLSGRSSRDEKTTSHSYQGKQIPEGGCAGDSVRKVGADDIDMSLASKLAYDSLAKSQESAKVRAALESWSTCMKGKGYTVATPFDAADIGTAGSSGVTLALADIDCKAETGLVGIWFAEDTAIQKAQIETHHLELEEARKNNENAVEAAEKALRG
ncbi:MULTISPECIES: hypothetical protein [unclassified Streptomyces]|uniref:hypothetical protein n=1 Tax=unclassified Streptomyces TaxID=2593676 RepID=UPI00039D3D56